MNLNQSPLTAAVADGLGACALNEHYLLQKYGSTMSLCDLAQELGTTANALRIRQLRTGDLPIRIPGMRAYRASTVTVAAWIASWAGITPPPQRCDDRNVAGPAKKRGRPRKLAPSAAKEGQA